MDLGQTTGAVLGGSDPDGPMSFVVPGFHTLIHNCQGLHTTLSVFGFVGHTICCGSTIFDGLRLFRLGLGHPRRERFHHFGEFEVIRAHRETEIPFLA